MRSWLNIMDTNNSSIFNPPNLVNIDGINLFLKTTQGICNRQIDDTRLSAEDEVLIATYPRTGTTWLSQIISLLLGGEENFEFNKSVILDCRVPYLEANIEDVPDIDRLDEFPKPRVDKTHLPYRFIKRWIEEDNIKTIITTRHPKDTLVSLYYFYKLWKTFEFSGTWNEFFEHFKAGYIYNGDQLSWYKDFACNVQSKHNVLYVRYEDMNKDIVTELKRIINFLDLNVPDAFIEKVLNVSTIKNMTEDSATNKQHIQHILTPGSQFIRNGICGEWKHYFTVAQNDWFDLKYKDGYQNCEIDIAYD